ncbi:MAG: DUF1554 domain-containing protein, partial [Myxococcaceae bacterium]|nr:DUF1554 domain-containing protein [Myxococcaceae bacterium]
GTSASGGGTSASGGGTAVTDAGPNFAFVTSQIFTGALGGIAGADTACQNAAADAGLSGAYRAWLSVDGGSAATRFAGARGWIRPDGKPFTDTLDGLLTKHRIFYPMMITERGTTTPYATSYVWTGTDDNGTGTAENCIDWSTADAGSTGYAGSPDDLGRGWTHNTPAGCNQPRPLFCMGYDRAVPVAPVRPADARVAFVTNGTYLLGPGLVAADQLCANEAAAAGLPGTFLALLSTDGGSAASRFKTDAGTWVRPDNAALMPTAAEVFTTGFLQAGMNVTPDAGTYTCGPAYWTGALSPTVVGTQTCMDWTSTNGQASARYGASCYLDRWFSHSTVPCDFQASHLYCLQQ